MFRGFMGVWRFLTGLLLRSVRHVLRRARLGNGVPWLVVEVPQIDPPPQLLRSRFVFQDPEQWFGRTSSSACRCAVRITTRWYRNGYGHSYPGCHYVGVSQSRSQPAWGFVFT